jgi:nucleoside-diphosphate-sugar epimerase
MSKQYLVTGATGFIGSHVAEACIQRGISVRTIARAGSDTALADRLGVTVVRGSLSDAEVVRKAVEGVDVIVHCAAKVGDRGAVEEYRAVNVEGLRGLLEACKDKSLQRFVYMSSLGVYEPRHHHGTDESEPVSFNHLDGYTLSKAEAEQIVWPYYRDHGVPLVVLRPGFVYGPRDKTVLPRLIERLRTGRLHYLGGDRRLLNSIYIGNLMDAVFLALDNPRAVGQVYNLTDGEKVSKERFINAIADPMGFARPRQKLPRWLAAIVARIALRKIRRAGPNGPTRLTAAQYKFILLNLDFSIEKARRELGYQPRVTFEQGMRDTMAWYMQKP